MQIQTIIRRLALAGAASVALGLAATAQAAPTLTPTGYANGSEGFHIVVGSPSLNQDVNAGGFIGAQAGLLPGPATILFWCYELDQYFGFNNAYTNYVAAAVTPPEAETALSELFTEVGGPDGAVTTTDRSAAFQLAVWEIKYDTGNGPYKLNSGNFQVTGGSTATRNLAQDWLDNLASPSYSVILLKSVAVGSEPGHQDFVTGRTALRAVPEPSPLPLLGAGLAALIVIIHRRRSSTQV